MKYTIIEDCSPYYIRFTFEGLDKVIDYCKEHMPTGMRLPFYQHDFPADQVDHILSLVPMAEKISFRRTKVSLFMTRPGIYYSAHKDRDYPTGHPESEVRDRFSFNFPIQVDDTCVTSWYSDEDLKDYEIFKTRCVGFDPTTHVALKSMVAKPNECVLFNTDLFHDYDNRKSSRWRVIFVLRIREDLQDTSFEDAKKIIFGN